MSPSLRERLVVGLSPESVQFVRYAPGWRPRLAENAAIRCAATSDEAWRGASEALARELPRRARPRSAWRVVLSNHFVRYQLVPWNPELRGQSEVLAMAQMQFRSVYGEIALRWSLRIAHGAFGASALACAVDLAMIERLEQIFAASGARIASLQPYVVAALNALRNRLRESEFWFAFIEPGRLVIGQIGSPGWVGLATRRLGMHPLAETLAGLAQQAGSGGSDVRPAAMCVVSGLGRARLKVMRKTGLRVLAAEPDAPLWLGDNRARC